MLGINEEENKNINIDIHKKLVDEKICILTKTAECGLRNYNGHCLASHQSQESYKHVKCAHSIDANQPK